MTEDLSPAGKTTREAATARRPRASAPAGLDRAVALNSAARARLVSALLVKGKLDLMFVAALAVAAHYSAFTPSFRGSLDAADGRVVAGWVVDRSAPRRRVEVQLYLDGKFAASGHADQPRPDVAAAGHAPDDRHGFVFRLDPPPAGAHEARVYAVSPTAGGARRTLQQIGSPISFVAE